MRVSVSLPEDDVAFLDECVRSRGLASRSAAVQKAVRMMRSAVMVDAYAEAIVEWSESDDAGLWDVVTDDGMSPH